MPQAIKPLAQVALAAAIGDVYVPPTQPPNLIAEVKSLIICNTAAAGRTFTLRVGTANPLVITNSLFAAFALAANETRVFGSNDGMVFLVQAGERVQGLASVAGEVIVSLYGGEMS